MLHKAAAGLHARMKINGVDAPSVDVIVYALSIVTNTLSIIGISLIAGALTGEFGRTLLLLVMFGSFRYLTGGYHIKSSLWCIIVSSAAMSSIPHIHLPDPWTLVLTSLSIAAVVLFAPSNYDKYARVSERHYPLLKGIACLVVASNFLIVSDILAMAFFVQSLMLPFKEGGEEQ